MKKLIMLVLAIVFSLAANGCLMFWFGSDASEPADPPPRTHETKLPPPPVRFRGDEHIATEIHTGTGKPAAEARAREFPDRIRAKD